MLYFLFAPKRTPLIYSDPVLQPTNSKDYLFAPKRTPTVLVQCGFLIYMWILIPTLLMSPSVITHPLISLAFCYHILRHFAIPVFPLYFSPIILPATRFLCVSLPSCSVASTLFPDHCDHFGVSFRSSGPAINFDWFRFWYWCCTRTAVLVPLWIQTPFAHIWIIPIIRKRLIFTGQSLSSHRVKAFRHTLSAQNYLPIPRFWFQSQIRASLM